MTVAAELGAQTALVNRRNQDWQLSLSGIFSRDSEFEERKQEQQELSLTLGCDPLHGGDGGVVRQCEGTAV